MKKVLILALGMAMSMAAQAQDVIETTVEADVVSKYVWRGLELGHAAVQPSLGLSYKGVSLGAWGSWGITDAADTEELDLTLSYTTGDFTVGVTDYWFNTPETRYFLYDAHRTSHVFEAFAAYDFGPVSATWYTNFAGNDGLNKDGKRAYSSYLELAAPFTLGGAEWQTAVGLVPWATTSYDATGLALTNLSVQATKNIKVTDSFALPLFAGIAANPSSQCSYLYVGFTLKP